MTSRPMATVRLVLSGPLSSKRLAVFHSGSLKMVPRAPTAPQVPSWRPDEAGEMMTTPLVHAAAIGHLEMARRLLDGGARPGR